MNNYLNKIHNYLLERGVDEEQLKQFDSSSVYLAMEIMEYAHRDQKRENGEEYANHPSRVLNNYRHLVGITEDDPFCIDKDLMHRFNIPFDGVQEVCLLHDVVEDTELTNKDIRDIYVECGFERYFDTFIKNALECITHDKTMDYDQYIDICLTNPISALVKMMDLQDNLTIIDLVQLNQDNYQRCQRYVRYIYVINNYYHFIENNQLYLKEFRQ